MDFFGITPADIYIYIIHYMVINKRALDRGVVLGAVHT
jgi:hypothetical protein